jgi:hypothetical protein
VSPRSLLATLALLLAWSCSDEDDGAPPPNSNPDAGESSGGASGGSGGTGNGGTNGGEPSGGTSGSSGSGAQGGSAGAGGVGDGGEVSGGSGGTPTGGTGTGGSAGFPACDSDSVDEPPTIAAQCGPEGSWGPAVDLPLMDGAAELVAITPDELSIAWYGNANMDTKFYVADRTSTAVDFGAGTELAYRDYLTLSPDGLRLVALGDSGELVELVRAARDQAFGTPAEGAFATLNADAAANDYTFLGAVVSPSDETLFYLVNDPGTDYPLHVSERTGSGPWPVGNAIEVCELKKENGAVRQPTGVSADGLTLFFNDFVRGVARAAWRTGGTSESADFTWFVDLGVRGHPQPNADCSRLYFHVTGGPAYAEAP